MRDGGGLVKSKEMQAPGDDRDTELPAGTQVVFTVDMTTRRLKIQPLMPPATIFGSTSAGSKFPSKVFEPFDAGIQLPSAVRPCCLLTGTSDALTLKYSPPTCWLDCGPSVAIVSISPKDGPIDTLAPSAAGAAAMPSAAAPVPAPAPPSRTACWTCNRNFGSRNGLFRHLEQSPACACEPLATAAPPDVPSQRNANDASPGGAGGVADAGVRRVVGSANAAAAIAAPTFASGLHRFEISVWSRHGNGERVWVGVTDASDGAFTASRLPKPGGGVLPGFSTNRGGAAIYFNPYTGGVYSTGDAYQPGTWVQSVCEPVRSTPRCRVSFTVDMWRRRLSIAVDAHGPVELVDVELPAIVSPAALLRGCQGDVVSLDAVSDPGQPFVVTGTPANASAASGEKSGSAFTFDIGRSPLEAALSAFGNTKSYGPGRVRARFPGDDDAAEKEAVPSSPMPTKQLFGGRSGFFTDDGGGGSGGGDGVGVSSQQEYGPYTAQHCEAVARLLRVARLRLLRRRIRSSRTATRIQALARRRLARAACKTARARFRAAKAVQAVARRYLACHVLVPARRQVVARACLRVALKGWLAKRAYRRWRGARRLQCAWRSRAALRTRIQLTLRRCLDTQAKATAVAWSRAYAARHLAALSTGARRSLLLAASVGDEQAGVDALPSALAWAAETGLSREAAEVQVAGGLLVLSACRAAVREAAEKFLELHDQPDAVQALLAAAACDGVEVECPGAATTLRALADGDAALRAGKSDEAVTAYDTAIAGGCRTARARLCLCLASSGLDAAEAKQALRVALQQAKEVQLAVEVEYTLALSRLLRHAAADGNAANGNAADGMPLSSAASERGSAPISNTRTASAAPPEAHVACLVLYCDHTSTSYRGEVPSLTSTEASELQALTTAQIGQHLAAFPLELDAASAADAGATAAGATAAGSTAAADDPNASAEVRWGRLKEKQRSGVLRLPHCPSMDALMAMRGCESVKTVAVDLCCRVVAEEKLSAAQRVVTSLNFAFLGNPGTGKSIAAKHLGQLLLELRLRRKSIFKETTGEALEREGGDKAAKLIDECVDGVLCVDKAAALNPRKSNEGRAVLNQLLAAAETHRERLTIILCDDKDELEEKVYAYDPGMKSRFRDVKFEDFSEKELRAIFVDLVANRQWTLHAPRVANVAARRLARGRGTRGFGNARDVRSLFERSYDRALSRSAGADPVLHMEDVVGPPPTPERLPALAEALRELDAMIGLEQVKRAARQLVALAKTNYHRELRGEAPLLVPLNRLFLGSPGTGKTVVSQIYGRILKGIGMLTDGSVEVRTPSDLIGSHVGESEEKTAALLDLCKGKVLVLDEAYALHGSSFGRAAIDTLVSKVGNNPGDDLAVVMLGYEADMRTMLREANPGLQRRFALEAAFRFEDFTDAQLELLLHNGAAQSGLTLGRQARKAALAELIKQRAQPNFGNAGSVNSLIGRAKQRLAARAVVGAPAGNGEAGAIKELTLADLGVDDARAKSERLLREASHALNGLCKASALRQHLTALQTLTERAAKEGRVDAAAPAQIAGNYVFVGGPGTGKSTFARVLATHLHGLGLLTTDAFVVVSALSLQGEYLGQTKKRVDDLLASCVGGMLFIDEAYSLGNRDLFSKEAVDQLTFQMTSSLHKDRTVVVLAGYTKAMDRMMANVNQGFASRFTRRLNFEDWDAEDCISYLKAKCADEKITLADAALPALRHGLCDLSERPGWANARDATSLFQELHAARAARLGASGVEEPPAFLPGDAADATANLARSRPSTTADPAGFFGHGDATPNGTGGGRSRRRGFGLSGVIFTAPTDISSSSGRSSDQRCDGPSIEDITPTTARSSSTSADEKAPPAAAAERTREAESSAPRSQAAEVADVADAVRTGGEADVMAALQAACVELGYDSSHAKRKLLVRLLSAVHAGGPFPTDILKLVCQKTGLSEGAATTALRPQVPVVLRAMRAVVAVEEQEIKDAKYKEDLRKRKKLKRMGLCEGGYGWHREGKGFRCNGGVCWMSDAEVDALGDCGDCDDD